MLIVGPRELGAQVARELAARGRDVVLITADGGLLGLAAAWARARRRPGPLLTISGSGRVHVLGSRLARRRRWIAHVDAPLGLSGSRRARLLDPRARALRRADVVTASPAAADELHRAAGVAVAHAPVDPARLAAVAATPPPAPAGGLTILMFGTLNTPHVEHMAMAMAERGHRVVVAGEITPAYPPSVLPAAGIDVRALEFPVMNWMRRLWRVERPDVVHANWMPSYGFLAALLRLRPLVAMAWGSDVYGATLWMRVAARYAARHADVAMSDSADLVERLVQMGASPAVTHQLNWGVDLRSFTPPADRRAVRSELGLGEGPTLLSPRALQPLYNPGVIVDAFTDVAADIPDAQLLLKHIGADAPDLGRPLPESVRIVGHVPYEQLPAYYQASEICISIPDSDSSPRSVWEAMASGCACVVSDLPWVHELIEGGRHALVVPPEREAVADALRRLLTEPGLAQRIGGEARALVERHRDQQAEMDRLGALYERLAGLRAA